MEKEEGRKRVRARGSRGQWGEGRQRGGGSSESEIPPRCLSSTLEEVPCDQNAFPFSERTSSLGVQVMSQTFTTEVLVF